MKAKSHMKARHPLALAIANELNLTCLRFQPKNVGNLFTMGRLLPFKLGPLKSKDIIFQS